MAFLKKQPSSSLPVQPPQPPPPSLHKGWSMSMCEEDADLPPTSEFPKHSDMFGRAAGYELPTGVSSVPVTPTPLTIPSDSDQQYYGQHQLLSPVTFLPLDAGSSNATPFIPITIGETPPTSSNHAISLEGESGGPEQPILHLDEGPFALPEGESPNNAELLNLLEAFDGSPVNETSNDGQDSASLPETSKENSSTVQLDQEIAAIGEVISKKRKNSHENDGSGNARHKRNRKEGKRDNNNIISNDGNGNENKNGPASPTNESNGDGAPLTSDELKKIRRLKNRASVEKCRHRQRARLESLSHEQKSLTKENEVLRNSSANVRTILSRILNQVATLATGAGGQL